MRRCVFWAAGFSIFLFAGSSWAQGFAHGGGGARGGFGTGAHTSPPAARSGQGAFARGWGGRPFHGGAGFRSRPFHRFFIGGFGGYYPYSFPYPYDYASRCCNGCSCAGGDAYDSREETGNVGEPYDHRTPIYSGPAPGPPDPEAERAALARRYPRHVIVHFDDQGLAEGETPLEIPARPLPAQNPAPENP